VGILFSCDETFQDYLRISDIHYSMSDDSESHIGEVSINKLGKVEIVEDPESNYVIGNIISSDILREGSNVEIEEEFIDISPNPKNLDEVLEKIRTKLEPKGYIVEEDKRIEGFNMNIISVTPTQKDMIVAGVDVSRIMREYGYKWVGSDTDHRGFPEAHFSGQGSGKVMIEEIDEDGEGTLRKIDE